MFKKRLLPLMLLLTACSQLPDNSHFQAKTSESSMQSTTASLSQSQTHNQTGVTLLENGLDALATRLHLIDQAKISIDVQYYLYHADISGHMFTLALWQAAERGVKVRLLLDDIALGGKDNILLAISSHPNIDVKLFNPFYRSEPRITQMLTRFGGVTRRMHNKSLVIDDRIAIIGGRNIGDVYFDASPKTQFNDLDVQLCGQVANELRLVFDEYWSHELAYPTELLFGQRAESKISKERERLLQPEFITLHEKRYFEQLLSITLKRKNDAPCSSNQYQGKVHILVDKPVKILKPKERKEFHLAPKLTPFLSDLKRELIIVSPYFVPEKDDLDFFAALIQRNVKVTILTNSLKSNDVPLTHAGYLNHRKNLLSMGVELYEFDSKSALHPQIKLSLHSKYFIADRESVFIGSMNLDPRSINENTEIGAVIKSVPLAEDMAQTFEHVIASSAFAVTLEDDQISWHKKAAHEDEFHHEPHSNFWERFLLNAARFLPGESQL
ncbi:phospholipase D-like domain-containing protein [Vibrio mexicanus]|uniref:phospholipase D-like domain-containing protein n=1 Tax=Vibrio mexicanus TaxID=1004326 RepID=UPI000699B620|nr:phospholipase D family protein [Vibrio mexicanus]